jgi:hypothetical protein
MDGFGAVMDRLQGLFGKAYLVAGLFPALLVALLCAPLVQLIDPDSPFVFRDFAELSGTRQTLAGLVLVIALASASGLVWMANPWFRRLFEGRVVALPGSTAWQRNVAATIDSMLEALRPDLVDYRFDVRDGAWQKALAEARSKPPVGTGPTTASEELKAGMRTLRVQAERGQRIPYTDMQATFVQLKKELEGKSAAADSALGVLQGEFLNLAQAALGVIEAEYARHRDRRRFGYPGESADIVASRLGNTALAHETYFVERYGANIELIWPGIDALAQKDEKFYPVLEHAKTKLDFSISMTALLGLYTAGWAAALLLAKVSWPAFVAVSVLGTLATVLFYRLSVWNAYAFQASIRSAVELYRFDLLKAMHIDLPANSTAEKDLWREITRLDEHGIGSVTFKHP